MKGALVTEPIRATIPVDVRRQKQHCANCDATTDHYLWHALHLPEPFLAKKTLEQRYPSEDWGICLDCGLLDGAPVNCACCQMTGLEMGKMIRDSAEAADGA